MRILHCLALLAWPAAKLANLWYSDEQGWSVTRRVNVKNDVIMVKKGEQSSTNIFRHTKSDESYCFSHWWVISRTGVKCSVLYEGTMDVKRFHKFLKNCCPL